MQSVMANWDSDYTRAFFAACLKAEMRKAKILVIACSNSVSISKTLNWPKVIMFVGTNLGWMQSKSMALGFNDKLEDVDNYFFAGVKEYLHSRGLMSKLREPTTAKATVQPGIKDFLESMGEIMDVSKESGFQKVTRRQYSYYTGICTPRKGIDVCIENDSAPLRREI